MPRGFATGPAIVVVDARVPDAEAILAALAVPATVMRVALGADALELIPAGRPAVICHGQPAARCASATAPWSSACTR